MQLESLAKHTPRDHTGAHSPVHASRVVAEVVANYVASTNWASLPQVVQHEAIRCQLNWLGVALAGSQTETCRKALSAVQAMGASGPAALVGHRVTLDPLQAAFINCLASSAQASDDTHLPTITHPGGPVVAVAWSVTGDLVRLGHEVSSADLLTAIALGVEIQCRLSNAVIAGGRGAHLGWYLTGISGGVGAAVAAGHLMRLPVPLLTTAIGLAATQAGGVRSTHGSMASALVPAFAARNGMSSAYLAREGVTCTDHVLDGPNGLFDVLSADCDPDLLAGQLGHHHEMLRNAYKPYACGIVIHAAIDACLQVGRTEALQESDITKLELQVHPSTLILCGRRLPDGELEAQVSLYHWAACALLHPGRWIFAASTESTRDAQCRALQSKITALADPGLGRAQARARLTLASGEIREALVEHATASAGNPMTDQQLDDKFLALACTVLPLAQAQALLCNCRAFAASSLAPMSILESAH